MGITYNGNKIKKAIFNGSPLKQIMLDGVKLLSGEPFNEALALVGYGEFNTLNDVLTNSSACTALAGNAEACGIMKSHYSSEMTSYIDSKFNDGLNLLNYKCKLKTYLFKNGNACNAITGGFKWQYPDANECAIVSGKLRLSRYSGDSHLWSNKKITLDGFSELHWNSNTWRGGSNSWNKVGFDSTQSSSGGFPFTAVTQSNTSSVGNKSVNISSLKGGHYFKAAVYGISYLTIDNLYIQ